jgi:hypothetical protein
MPTILSAASGGLQPDAPTIGIATAGNAAASVSFIAPVFKGKAQLSDTYTARAFNSTGTVATGQSKTGSTSPLEVTGLTNGTTYTFRVDYNNGYATSLSSSASNTIVPILATTTTPVPTTTVAPTTTTTAAPGVAYFSNAVYWVSQPTTVGSTMTLNYTAVNAATTLIYWYRTNSPVPAGGSNTASGTLVQNGETSYIIQEGDKGFSIQATVYVYNSAGSGNYSTTPAVAIPAAATTTTIAPTTTLAPTTTKAVTTTTNAPTTTLLPATIATSSVFSYPSDSTAPGTIEGSWTTTKSSSVDFNWHNVRIRNTSNNATATQTIFSFSTQSTTFTNVVKGSFKFGVQSVGTRQSNGTYIYSTGTGDCPSGGGCVYREEGTATVIS